MKISVIDNPAEGSPVLLAPEGILLRWPRDEPLPEIGDDFEGKIVRVSKPEQRELLINLLCGNPLERCDAVRRLPPSLVKSLYSRSQANNMRRVAHHMTPALRLHVVGVIADGLRVSMRQLVAAVVGRTEAEQLKRWNEALGR